MDIQLEIKNLIEKQGVSYKDFGEKLGRSRQNVYDILNGKQQITIDLLSKISQVLNVPITYFFEDKAIINNEIQIFIGFFRENKGQNNSFLYMWHLVAIMEKAFFNTPEIIAFFNRNQNLLSTEYKQICNDFLNLPDIRSSEVNVIQVISIISSIVEMNKINEDYESIFNKLRLNYFNELNADRLFEILLKNNLIEKAEIDNYSHQILVNCKMPIEFQLKIKRENVFEGYLSTKRTKEILKLKDTK
jgi:transcriptional regulator with XRE-family HTH domain